MSYSKVYKLELCVVSTENLASVWLLGKLLIFRLPPSFRARVYAVERPKPTP